MDDQWEPLWSDIRDRAEAVLATGNDRDARQRVYPHFLGAIVTSQTHVFGKEVHAYAVIDGQQRLTTLQLILAAFRDFVNTIEDAPYHADLLQATRNHLTVAHEHERYKVWPTNVDRESFSAVLDSGSREAVAGYLRDESRAFRGKPRLAQAYLFFYDQIAQWVNGDNEDRPQDDSTLGDRVDALFDALRRLLQVVEIALEEGDDPQVIFETLNARGAPLLPSDLVRNFVFTQANRRNEDADYLYEQYWRWFDDVDTDPFWKEDITFGREKRQRLVLFLYHFLTSVLATDLSISHLFDSFKRWWDGDRGPETTEQGLQTLTKYAIAYKTILQPDPKTRLGRFTSRLQVVDVTTLHPLLLYLLVELRPPKAELNAIVEDLESYVVRRSICRLAAKNYNRYFLTLLQEVKASEGPVHGLIRQFLLSGTGESVVWPNDADMRYVWLNEPAYQRVRSRGLRMILEALNAESMSGYEEGVILEKPPTVEHIMPQAWQRNWTPPQESEGDELPEQRRNRLLHTYGNLTLLSQRLNSKLGNAGYNERRAEIRKQTEMRLNLYFDDVLEWDETAILKRGEHLFEIARQVWPRPEGSKASSSSLILGDEASRMTIVHEDPVLVQIIEAFNANAPAGTNARGRARDYRQVRVVGWPGSLHYEVTLRAQSIDIGLHLELAHEHPRRKPVESALDALVDSVREAFPGYRTLSENRGNWRWLTVSLEGDMPPELVAEGMARMIEITREPITLALATS